MLLRFSQDAHFDAGSQLDGFKPRLEYNGEFHHDYQGHSGVLRASWDF